MSLEPGGLGFENNAKMASHILNNVLEHLTDFELALSNLFHYLSENGVIIQSCRKHALRFKPHFGIPLTPTIQQQTEVLCLDELEKAVCSNH